MTYRELAIRAQVSGQYQLAAEYWQLAASQAKTKEEAERAQKQYLDCRQAVSDWMTRKAT